MRRQDPLKTTTLGKIKGNRRRGRPNTRWTDSLKEPTGLSPNMLLKTGHFEDNKTEETLQHITSTTIKDIKHYHQKMTMCILPTNARN